MSRVFDTIFAAIAGAVLATFATLAALLAGGAAGLGVPRQEPIPRALAEARLDAERAVAEGLGLTLAEEHELVGREPRTVPIELAEGECVAAIATRWGAARARTVMITPPRRDRWSERSPDALSSDPFASGLVSHTQWCADVARPIEITATAAPHGEPGAPSGGRLLVLRGRADPHRLARGWILREPPPP